MAFRRHPHRDPADRPLAVGSREKFLRADATSDPEERERLVRQAHSLAGNRALADAYAYLQKAVGLIALTLPFVVVIGHEVLGGDGLKGSISAYYYTHTGNYFVGSLFALGVFFLSYNYRPLPEYRWDNILSNVACLLAVGVALLPTAGDVEKASGGATWVSRLHLGFAGALFVLLAVFSYFFFTRTDDPQNMTPAKRRRNLVFRMCGVIIAGAIVLILVALVVEPPSSWHAILVLESVAVVTFGMSWLVKGAFLGWLADR